MVLVGSEEGGLLGQESELYSLHRVTFSPAPSASHQARAGYILHPTASTISSCLASLEVSSLCCHRLEVRTSPLSCTAGLGTLTRDNTGHNSRAQKQSLKKKTSVTLISHRKATTAKHRLLKCVYQQRDQYLSRKPLVELC